MINSLINNVLSINASPTVNAFSNPIIDLCDKYNQYLFIVLLMSRNI